MAGSSGLSFRRRSGKVPTRKTYPEARTAPRFHGRHQLNRDRLEKGIGRRSCAWAARPILAILVEGADNRRDPASTRWQGGSAGAERYGRVYQKPPAPPLPARASRRADPRPEPTRSHNELSPTTTGQKAAIFTKDSAASPRSRSGHADGTVPDCPTGSRSATTTRSRPADRRGREPAYVKRPATRVRMNDDAYAGRNGRSGRRAGPTTSRLDPPDRCRHQGRGSTRDLHR